MLQWIRLTACTIDRFNMTGTWIKRVQIQIIACGYLLNDGIKLNCEQ